MPTRRTCGCCRFWDLGLVGRPVSAAGHRRRARTTFCRAMAGDPARRCPPVRESNQAPRWITANRCATVSAPPLFYPCSPAWRPNNKWGKCIPLRSENMPASPTQRRTRQTCAKLQVRNSGRRHHLLICRSCLIAASHGTALRLSSRTAGIIAISFSSWDVEFWSCASSVGRQRVHCLFPFHAFQKTYTPQPFMIAGSSRYQSDILCLVVLHRPVSEFLG